MSAAARFAEHALTTRFEDLPPEVVQAAKTFILDGVKSGSLKPVIAKTFAFDQIVEAHRYLESNQQFGKIVVTID